MGERLEINFNEGCYDSAVDEVDVLVPHYLEALDKLGRVQDLAEIPSALANVVTYWERLNKLFAQIEPLEEEIPFREIMQDTLQTELSVLEQVYLRVNLKIEFVNENWSADLWNAAESILERMDAVLCELEFPEDHEDRRLIIEMRSRNLERRESWEANQ